MDFRVAIFVTIVLILLSFIYFKYKNHKQPQQDLSDSLGRLHIYVGTETGNALSRAQILADDAIFHKFSPTIISLENFQILDFKAQDYCVIICSTQQNGEPPENTQSFLKWLSKIQQSKDNLNKMSYCVFGLSKSPNYYYTTAARINSQLAKLSAFQIIAMGQSSEDDYNAFDQWRDCLWQVLPSIVKKSRRSNMNDMSLLQVAYHVPLTEYKKNQEYDQTTIQLLKSQSFKIINIKELKKDPGNSAYHIEFECQEYYEPGWQIALFPQNDQDAIRELATQQGYKLEDTFMFLSDKKTKQPFPTPVTLQEALQKYCDISSLVTKKTLKQLAKFATEQNEKQRLEYLASIKGKDDYRRFIQKGMLSISDILAMFPSVSIPSVALVQVLQRIKPRYYLISSSRNQNPHTLSITIQVLRNRNNEGKTITGLCCGFFQKMHVTGMYRPVQGFISPSQFKIPRQPLSIIMVSIDCGISPFRSFIQELQYLKSEGLQIPQSYMFYGCRQKNKHFVYRDDIEKALVPTEKDPQEYEYRPDQWKTGIPVIQKLYTAFLRDQPMKTYVQDAISSESELIWQVISQGGYSYICGPTSFVKSVIELLHTIVADKVGDQAARFVQRLEVSGRLNTVMWWYKQNMNDLLGKVDISQSVLNSEDLQVIRTGFAVSQSEDDFSESQSLTYTPRDSDRHPRTYELKILKEDYERTIRELSTKVKQLNREKSGIEDTLQIQRSNFKNEMRALKEAHLSEIEGFRRAQRRMEHEAPLLKERIDSLKQQLKTVAVSEEYYYELKAIPEEQRSIRDWVLCKVYEEVGKYRESQNRDRSEIQQLKQELTVAVGKLSRTQRELQHTENHTGSCLKDLERKYEQLAEQNKRIHQQLDHFKGLAAENSEKALRFDEIASNAKKMQETNEKLNNQVEAQITQISSLNQDKLESKALLDSRNKELEILTRDKQFLNKQNQQLIDKVQRLEDRNDRLEIQIVQAKNAAQSYLNKLLDTRTSHTSSFEEKLQKQVQQIRVRHSRELEEIKASLSEIHQQRVNYLKQSKQHTDIRNLKLEQDLKDKSEAYQSLLQEYRTMHVRTEQIIQELRSELRMKTDSSQRSHSLYQEALVSLRHSKAENSMLKEKIQVLKQELFKAETQTAKENADIKAQLAIARENLQQYALIEQELDHAIQNQDVQGFQAPTTSKRRIQQSLQLAKQLKMKSSQLEALKAENARLKAEQEKVQSEVILTKQLLQQTDQPHSYLVQQIQVKEREISELKRQLNIIQQKYLDLGAEQEILLNKNAELQNDIKQILTKRDTIESMKSMLTQLADDKPTKKLQAKDTNPAWFNTLKRKYHK